MPFLERHDQLALPGRARRLLPPRSRERQAARLGPGPRARGALRRSRTASTAGAGRRVHRRRRRDRRRRRAADASSERVRPAFARLLEHVRPYTPEWAAGIADVPAETIRRLAARVPGTRPGRRHDRDRRRQLSAPARRHAPRQDGDERLGRLRVLLGAHGAGGARRRARGARRDPRHHGAAQPPRPEPARLGPARARRLHGAAAQPDRQGEVAGARRTIRNAYRTLVPLADNSPVVGGARARRTCRGSSWTSRPEHWPAPTLPDVWIIYRTNPAISNWDTGRIERELERFPFVAAFAYTQDETNWYADLLLPGGDGPRVAPALPDRRHQVHRAVLAAHGLGAPPAGASAPPCDTRDLTDIATELAARIGLLDEYLAALNRGSGTTVPLAGDGLRLRVRARRPALGRRRSGTASAAPRPARSPAAPWSATSTGSSEHGAFFVPFATRQYFLHAAMVAQGLRYELPYQERIKRIGRGARARGCTSGASRGGTSSSTSTSRCPTWKDFPGIWQADGARATGRDGRGVPLLAPHEPQHAVLLGLERLAADPGRRGAPRDAATSA